MFWFLSATLAACGGDAQTHPPPTPDAGLPIAEAAPSMQPLASAAPEEVAAPSYELGPAQELSLPALRARIEARQGEGELDAALDDMDVFVFRFARAPSSEGYRALMREHGREVRERPALVRRRSVGRGLFPAPPPRPRGVPAVVVSPPRVRGGRPPENIHRVMRRHANELRFCYERTLQRRPDVQGRIGLRFVITPAATVGASTVTANSTGDPALGECAAARIRRWRFPPCTGCGVDVVQADVVFTQR